MRRGHSRIDSRCADNTGTGAQSFDFSRSDRGSSGACLIRVDGLNRQFSPDGKWWWTGTQWIAADELLANHLERFVVWLMNFIVWIPAIVCLSWLASNVFGDPVAFLVALAVYVLMFHLVPMSVWGLTIGGFIAGVRVVRIPDAGPPGIARGLLRLTTFMTTFPAVIALMLVTVQLFGLPRRLWWDVAAGTQVVVMRRVIAVSEAVPVFRDA